MQLNKPNQDATGKLIGDKRYLHIDTLPVQADSPAMQGLLARVAQAEALAGVRRGEHFNLIRVEAGGNTLALLHYPAFPDDPSPRAGGQLAVGPGRRHGGLPDLCGLAESAVPASQGAAADGG